MLFKMRKASDVADDDYVGPEDIAVFAEYFGQRLLACAQ